MGAWGSSGGGGAGPEAPAPSVTPQVWYSSVRRRPDPSVTITGEDGSYTMAQRYQAMRAITISGVRLYWDGAYAVTMKVSIWNAANSRVAVASASVPAVAGTVDISFTTPYEIAAGAIFRVSIWNSAHYLFLTDSAALPLPALVGDGLYLLSLMYGSGDSNPDGGSSLLVPFEPILA